VGKNFILFVKSYIILLKFCKLHFVLAEFTELYSQKFAEKELII